MTVSPPAVGPASRATVVLGLGNPLLTDDAAGWRSPRS